MARTSLLEKLGSKPKYQSPTKAITSTLKPIRDIGRQAYDEGALVSSKPVEPKEQSFEDIQKEIKALVSKPNKTQAEIDRAKALSQEFYSKQAEEKKFGQGFASGVSAGIAPRITEQLYTPETKSRVDTAKSGLPYIAGNLLGTGALIAGGYGAFGGAVTGPAITGGGGVGGATGTLAPSLAQKIGYLGATGTAGALAGELAKDVAIGAPIAAVQSLASGRDVKKELAENLLIDIAMGTGFSLLGKGFKALKGLKQTDDVVQQLAKQSNIPLDEAKKVIDDVIDNTPVQRTDELMQMRTRTPQAEPILSGVDNVASSVDNIVGSVDNVTPKPSILQRMNETPLENLDNQANRTMAANIETDIPSQTIAQDTLTLKERGFSENIRTDANRVDELRKEFDSNPEFYDVLSNKSTLDSAQARFDKGYEEALKDFDATKKQLRPDNVPLSKLIADEAVRRGDMQTARRVIIDVAESLTTAGQYSQAAKILRESNDPVTVLRFVQQEINKLNEQGLKRLGKGTKLSKGWEDIQLNNDELELIGRIGKDATDEQKEELFQQLFNSVSKRIPTTNREKFDSFRRMAMLFNPKTHVRNTLGNAIMGATKKIADTIAVGLEKTLLPKELRTKSLSAPKELKTIAENYWEANKKQLVEGSRWEIFGTKTPFADKRIFNNNVLEKLNQISKDTLNEEDIFFFKRHFKSDLANFMNARGLKEPTKEATDYALRRAQEATFREANALSDAINKLKGTKAGLIVDAAIPFTKTPANILVTGTKFSPIGLVESVYQLARGETPEKIIETFSKGLTGTGLTMVGYYMAMNGFARGEYEKNNRVEGLKQASGELPNSLVFPNGSYTIDWAQPTAIPFFMGVGLAESLKKSEGEDKLSAGFEALVAGGDTLVNSSMLRNVKDLFGGSYGSTTENLLQLPIDYLTQAFPTVSGQIARTIDPTKRQLDYNSFAETTKQQLQAKTPGLSKLLPPKRDVLGQEMKYGSGFLNAIQQFLSPGYVGVKANEPVLNELNRLYESEGSSFLPRAKVNSFTSDKVKYTLDNKEISEFQKIMGNYTNDKISSIIKTSGYKSLSDEGKAKVIKDINDDGYDLAKEKIISSRRK